MNYGEAKALKRRLADDKHQANARTEHALAMLGSVLDINHSAPGLTPAPRGERMDGIGAALDDAVKALRIALRSAEVLRAELRKHMKGTS